MSVARIDGIRKAARQLTVALVACLAVAGAAAMVVAPGTAPDAASAPSYSVAGAAETETEPTPSPTPSPSSGNGWNGTDPIAN